MAKKVYPVQRDGVQFEVRAESAEEARQIAETVDLATVPKVIARKGKTRVLQRPNGQSYLVSPEYSTSDPKKIEQFLSGMTAGEIYRTGIDEELLQKYPVAARAGEFARGVPFAGSYLDEALGAALGPEAATGARALSGAMQRQRPRETLGLNIAGGVTGTAAAALAAPAQLGGLAGGVVGQGTRLSQVARGAAGGAAAGATEGAIYGYGEGASPEERAFEAGQGAAIGGTAGTILGGAAPVAAEAVSNVIGLFRRSDVKTIAREFGISTDAAKVIKNTFDQGGDMSAAMNNLRRAGEEGMLVDAGPAAQALLDATAVSGGSAGRIVRDEISGRMSRTGEAVERSLNTALGAPPEGPRTAVNQIAARTAPERDRLYGEAYSSAIDYASEAGRDVESVIGRINRIAPNLLRDAIREANAEMEYNRVFNQQIMAQIGDDGSVKFVEMPNVQQLDEIKKALGKIAFEDNVDQFGRLTSTGRRYAGLADELKEAVSEAVPSYKSAVSVGGDKIREERAFMFGQDLLKTSTKPEDIKFELGVNPSQAQVDAAKNGLRGYIDEALGNVRAIASDPSVEALEARQVIKAVTDLSSDNARKKIRSLMGAEADALLAQIDEAAQSATVRAAMAQNSKTAGRVALKETVDEITAPGVVGQAAQGEAINTTKALIQAVTGQTAEYSAARRQKIYEDIARALTQKKGRDAATALRVLDMAMQGQQLTDTQTDQLAKMISGVLFSGTATGATRGAAAERRQAQ